MARFVRLDLDIHHRSLDCRRWRNTRLRWSTEIRDVDAGICAGAVVGESGVWWEIVIVIIIIIYMFFLDFNQLLLFCLVECWTVEWLARVEITDCDSSRAFTHGPSFDPAYSISFFLSARQFSSSSSSLSSIHLSIELFPIVISMLAHSHFLICFQLGFPKP